jgi:hypothetical protein
LVQTANWRFVNGIRLFLASRGCKNVTYVRNVLYERAYY